MNSTLPKLSYVLLSHNREKYIRAAIESAFAQDYEGELEYIFSDDCSTDRTFEIIKECVAEYKGNRRVVVTQTPRNLHLAGNTNHAVQFVESDWIVRADDDDYSSVDRCSLIGNAIKQYADARYVTTGVLHFTDADDNRIREKANTKFCDIPNITVTDICCHSVEETDFHYKKQSYKAWHMDVFRKFGALPEKAYYIDDLTCFYRASVLGTGVHLHNVTAVYARDGSANMSLGGDDNQRGYASIIRLEKFNDLFYNITYEPLLGVCDAIEPVVKKMNNNQALLFVQNIRKKISEQEKMRYFWRKGVFYRLCVTAKYGKITPFSLLRCLPMKVFATVLALVRIIKKSKQK